MYSIELDIPRDWWWTANDRVHWSTRARRTRNIRQAAAIAARHAPRYNTAHVTAYVAYPRNNRADPSNVASTVLKAALDGLTDAGVWADDDSEHVTAVTIRRDAPTGRAGVYRLRLVLTPGTPDVRAYSRAREGVGS